MLHIIRKIIKVYDFANDICLTHKKCHCIFVLTGPPAPLFDVTQGGRF